MEKSREIVAMNTQVLIKLTSSGCLASSTGERISGPVAAWQRLNMRPKF